MHFQETPKTATFPCNFVTMMEEEQATAIDNMHKTFCKDRECGSRDILVDRQTHTQTYSSQCFATAPAGKVIITTQLSLFNYRQTAYEIAMSSKCCMKVNCELFTKC